MIVRALITLSALLGGVGDERVWVDRETVLMGATLRVELEAPSEEEARRVVDRLFAVAFALDRRWTTHDPESELAAANEAELGASVSLGDETFRLLARAWELSDRTDGAFEPGVGSLIRAWESEGGVGQPTSADLRRALASSGRGCFDLSPATRTIARRCPHARLDAGGVGKGAALSALQDVLEAEGIARARIAFGDQILLHGAPRSPTDAVRLADPRLAGRPAFRWPGKPGSYATSSRSLVTGPGSTDLVLDPRTGLPVEPWGSVTVRSSDPVEADALATALFVMGPEDGIRWLAARPRVEAVFVVAGEEGVVACGRESIVSILMPLHEGASRSAAPLVSPNLRGCG